jgi:putative transposase
MPLTIDIKQGQLVQLPTGLYEFKQEKRNNVLLFEREDTGLELRMPEHRFVDLHSKGKAKLIEFRSSDETQRLDNPEFGPNELWTDEDDPKRAKLTREGRRSLALQFYTRKWDELGRTPKGDKGLQALIAKWRPVAIQSGLEPGKGEQGFMVKPARLRRCIHQCGEPGNRPLRVFRSLRGKTSRRRYPEEVEKLIGDAIEFYWSDRVLDYNDAYAKLRTEAEALNEARPRGLKLAFPERQDILRRRIRKTMCFENWASKYDKTDAWRKFKGNEEHIKAEWPLELVIMDHTVFDTWMVFDTKEFLPLGRPGLTIAIDVCTRMIVGYLLIFEPPSVYTIQTVLKRVNKNKRYVRTVYPHIKEGWDGWGRPNEVLVDQAWENKSPSFRHSLRELGTDLILAPARTPEFKAIGERFFRTMNQMLAHKLAGGVPYNPYIMRSVGLDPKQDAILSLDDLDALIHEAIIGYHHRKHKGIGALPARVWRDKIAYRKRHIIRDVAALDDLVGRVESVELTTAGIRFRNMTFHDPEVTSDLLDDLVRYEKARTQSDRTYGPGRVKVVIKWNPADCGSVRVWNRGAATPGYVTLRNKDPKFFDGLSFWHWEKIREFGELKDHDCLSEAGRWKARDELRRQWEKLVGKLRLADSRDARRGLAFSQGTFDDTTFNDESDDDFPIQEEEVDPSTDGLNRAKPQPVSDEMYAATIDGENPKIDGRKPSRKSVAKRQRTIERQKREQAEEARERAAREFGEATIARSDPSLKEEADMSSLAKGKGWDPLDAPPRPEDQDDDDSTGGGGPLDDLPSGKGWDY